MAYCPYYDKDCPENNECYLWDVPKDTCTIIRQKFLLEMIMASTGVHIHSDPPTGYYKVLNIYYDESTDEHVVIREDIPI